MYLGVIEYAISRNTLIGGDDFKTGQTKIKSVLVDFLVGAGIKVIIIGNIKVPYSFCWNYKI